MGIYGRVRATIEAEAALPLGKRTQSVPCAFCTRGGNGDRSCSCVNSTFSRDVSRANFSRRIRRKAVRSEDELSGNDAGSDQSRR